MLPQRLEYRQFSIFSIELPSLSAKNSISASDNLLAENPIKAWAIHTPTLSRRGRLWIPGDNHSRTKYPSLVTCTCIAMCYFCLWSYVN